jgi:heme a synthase
MAPGASSYNITRCKSARDWHALANRYRHAMPSPQPAPRALANWLFFVAFLVLAIVIVGGITRLTESGLSITEWRVVTGVLPPLSEAAWGAEFEKYKLVPQYEAIHASMTLAQFKFIYFWEWVHRLLARGIGLALIATLAWFGIRRTMPKGYGLRVFALFALVCLQGTVGWWMVKSGLWQGVAVSHYRLAVHLLLALTILAATIWTALDLRALASNPAARPARLTGFALAVGGVLLVQLLYGAWVAGMRAGKVSQNWPMMSDRFLPTGIDWSQGALHAFSSDLYLVHFIHRWWAWVAVAALVMLAIRVKRAGVRPASLAIHTAFGTQVLLGIATVMTGVNIWLAVAHQAVGALLVASVAWDAHVLGRQR